MSGYGEGPWTIEYDNDVGPNDESFVEWFDVGPARLMFDTRMGEREQARRIARLIAAAPDLLAACKTIAEGPHDAEAIADMLVTVRAAIAAAEGETP
jgi:hypothetical protein